MFEAMAELEALCAGLAAERMTGAERRELEDAHEELRALIQWRSAALSRDQRGVPRAIYAGAHNAYLAEMTLATRARVQPFRRAQFRNLGRLAKSMSSTTASWSRSCAATAKARPSAMRAHIETVREEYGLYIEFV